MKDPLQRLFLREKPSLALLALNEMETAYIAQIAKHIDSTVPHTSSILSELEEHGLISSRPEGRIRCLVLTDRGVQVARALKDLFDLLHRPDALMLRLEWLQKMVSAAEGPEKSLILGPLRRDLAKLMAIEDPRLQKSAEELDRKICALLQA